MESTDSKKAAKPAATSNPFEESTDTSQKSTGASQRSTGATSNPFEESTDATQRPTGAEPDPFEE
jgi:hypothetical protein